MAGRPGRRDERGRVMARGERKSLKPMAGAARLGRERLSLRSELALAFFPTVTLFSALASSAFLIYLDPMHGTNRIPAVVGAHMTGAAAGMFGGWVLGYGYGAAGLAMVVTILVMIVADIVHPPAIGTSLSFAYRAGLAANVTLFLIALGMVVLLVVLQKATQYVLVRLTQ